MARRLFVGNLPFDTLEREVDRLFDYYGRINRVELKQGFGFIEFDHPRDAEDALRALDGYTFRGHRLRVEIAQGRGRRDDRRSSAPMRTDYRVVVEGLPSNMSWQTLKDAMRRGGEVVYVDITDRGTGIAEFRTLDGMYDAIDKLNDTAIEGAYIRVREDRGGRRDSYDRHSRRFSPYRSSRYRTPSPRGRRGRTPSPRRRPLSPSRRSPSQEKHGSRRDRSYSRDRSPARYSHSPRDKSMSPRHPEDGLNGNGDAARRSGSPPPAPARSRSPAGSENWSPRSGDEKRSRTPEDRSPRSVSPQ